MKNDLTVTNIFDIGAQRYPHLKLTAEDFPRVLATRRIEEDDNAEYYGAMLPRTGVRILIDLLNKTFKLRTCDIDRRQLPYAVYAILSTAMRCTLRVEALLSRAIPGDRVT